MTATIAEPVIIDRPGVYDLSEAQYFGDPVPSGSLSNSGAKLLLPPSCPAKFRYYADNEQAHRRHFDFGSAAHFRVLGAGPEVRVIEAKDYRTKAAQAERDQAYADGATPVLREEYEQVKAMAEAIHRHPIASVLFNPDHGQPEQSLFWVDGETGIYRRCRLDWLPDPRNGRMILPDYKTAASISDADIQRAVLNFGYFRQGPWYLDGVQAVGLADERAVFLFVIQEKTAPYLIRIVQLDAMAMRIGYERNRQAIEIFRDCNQVGLWPGYSDAVDVISLPYWAENAYLKETEA